MLRNNKPNRASAEGSENKEMFYGYFHKMKGPYSDIGEWGLSEKKCTRGLRKACAHAAQERLHRVPDTGML